MFIFLNLNNIIDFLLNMLLLTIPENIFLIMFCLLIMKQFDFIGSKNEGERKIRRRDITEVASVSLFLALCSQIFYQLNFSPNARLAILSAIFPILIILVYRCWTLDAVIKTIICCLCSVLVFIIIEFSYLPLIFYATNKSAKYYTGSLTKMFILSIPERIIDYSIIAYLLIKKINFNKANLFKIIFRSKVLQIATAIVILFNLISFAILGKFIWMDRILMRMPFLMQSVIVIIVLLIPIVNIILFLFILYYIANTEQYQKALSKEMLEKLTVDLGNSVRDQKYDKLDLILQDIKTNVEDLYQE